MHTLVECMETKNPMNERVLTYRARSVTISNSDFVGSVLDSMNDHKIIIIQ